MFGFRRRDVSVLGVRFCDGCGGVTTAAQRAARRREQEWARTAAGRSGR
jgi:hypothetical protein